MRKMVRKAPLLAGGLIALILIIALLAWSTAAADATVSVTITPTTVGDITTYAISITNNLGYDITSLTIKGYMPASGSLVSYTPGGTFDGLAVTWINTGIIKDGGKLVGFDYGVKNASGVARAVVSWGSAKGPGSASAEAAAVRPAPAPTPEPPRRGCLACHTVRDPATGKYTLAYEAFERAKAAGLTHPTTAPDGTKLDPKQAQSVAVCLTCHKGSSTAPLPLRSIVHPAHMFSKTFVEHYKGNCFSCHDVDGEGEYLILGKKVDVNEKGVPKVFPIPGTIKP
ncbi:MAG: DUF11 domain-containing protein [Chloroflexi bacterium]|nr:DUF11 domain-containing protein [Chloroflexota bacterium]MCL5075861.1 DUF11 domain-containing protein [Chloroflexota bacterium]